MRERILNFPKVYQLQKSHRNPRIFVISFLRRDNFPFNLGATVQIVDWNYFFDFSSRFEKIYAIMFFWQSWNILNIHLQAQFSSTVSLETFLRLSSDSNFVQYRCWFRYCLCDIARIYCSIAVFLWIAVSSMKKIRIFLFSS